MRRGIGTLVIETIRVSFVRGGTGPLVDDGFGARCRWRRLIGTNKKNLRLFCMQVALENMAADAEECSCKHIFTWSQYTTHDTSSGK